MESFPIDKMIAEKVMGWEFRPYEEFGFSMWVDSSNQEEWKIGVDEFHPSENIEHAWMVAQKLGLALIPQSTDEGYHWFACDIEKVSHTGQEISITPLGDAYYSAETATMAICLAALEKIK